MTDLLDEEWRLRYRSMDDPCSKRERAAAARVLAELAAAVAGMRGAGMQVGGTRGWMVSRAEVLALIEAAKVKETP